MKFFGDVLKEILTFLVLAVIIVLPIRFFVAQPWVVEGQSMHPTFEGGDYLIVDELTYRFEAPKRGDVIVFRYPGDPKVFYIKRIIGLPNETLHIDHGQVDVTKTDGSTIALTEPYILAEDATYTGNKTLGANEYFVMGDNRPNSADSRMWGPLPKQDIMGRVFVRLLPVNEIGVFPGATTLPQ